MTKIKTVLLITYACEPNETSEPGVGWNMSEQISQSYTTFALTRANNRKPIEAVEKSSITFLYYDLPKLLMILKKKLPLGTQLYYALWQWGAYFYAKRYFKKSKIKLDLVHHLNFAASWIAPPGYLFKLPFVWGPIGGGDTVPMHFLKQMSFKSLAQEIIYSLTNNVSKISIFSFFTRRKASAILFRTQSISDTFSSSKNTIYKTISETATTGTHLTYKAKVHTENIHAICVGRMNYWKGYIFAVKGFHEFLKAGGHGKLELFGEGTEKDDIYAYIKANDLEDHIFIRGFVSNVEIKKKMEGSDVLLHPSFREGGSWSIMEAMSYGLPVICLDTSGPKDMVTKEAGILIAIHTPEQVSEDIGKGLLELSKNQTKYLKLSTNAHNRIRNEYNWSRRKDQISEVYENVIRSATN